MRKTFIYVLLLGLCFACTPQDKKQTLATDVTLSKEVLFDKIKGGWAGQTIGCTYGGPTEFRFRGTMIQDYNSLGWSEGSIQSYFDHFPELYDDLYMDLTFVEVFDRLGLDAPVNSFALSFANAPYPLWHANQAARYNILNGIMPPESGHWLNNPHADDIDYQIEADFAGLMTPGMVNSSAEISDKIGHIMNYGDGWYGGVYVAAMYSLAFVSDDVEFVVNEALKVIPEGSKYHECMSDVIRWHKQYPNDWKQTWFECERKWNQDIGCPEGTLVPYNIDATINSAYILIGLLYGEKDFYKTIDIATRCGQDSDCNPASAGGILGTMIGYNNIPEYWTQSIELVKDRDFKYTTTSLTKASDMSYRHALEMITRNGGKVTDTDVTIVCQQPIPVRLEQGFEGHYPIKRDDFKNKTIETMGEYKFNGIGVVFTGRVKTDDKAYVVNLEVYIDGKLSKTMTLPANKNRSDEIFWKYQLPKAEHVVTFKWLNPRKDVTIGVTSALVYSDQPVDHQHAEKQNAK